MHYIIPELIWVACTKVTEKVEKREKGVDFDRETEKGRERVSDCINQTLSNTFRATAVKTTCACEPNYQFLTYALAYRALTLFEVNAGGQARKTNPLNNHSTMGCTASQDAVHRAAWKRIFESLNEKSNKELLQIRQSRISVFQLRIM